jgi:hypothetical protein
MNVTGMGSPVPIASDARDQVAIISKSYVAFAMLRWAGSALVVSHIIQGLANPPGKLSIPLSLIPVLRTF